MFTFLFLIAAVLLGRASKSRMFSASEQENARMGSIWAFGTAVILTMLEVGMWL